MVNISRIGLEYSTKTNIHLFPEIYHNRDHPITVQMWRQIKKRRRANHEGCVTTNRSAFVHRGQISAANWAINRAADLVATPLRSRGADVENDMRGRAQMFNRKA